MDVPVDHYLVLAAILFAIGVFGVLFRRNVIVMLMSVELMLNGVNITFVAFARRLWDLDGQVVVFFVMTVAAAEAAVGLAIFLVNFTGRKTLNADELRVLQG
ncbi:MAG: NADH-quinone oxidoreductase subunit NuoK [Deltaproteobacteria bacterium]